MIYMDHAATSWPKPPAVVKAMVDFLERAGGNPGRSGHRLSIAAGRVVYETRNEVAELFGAPDPLRVVMTPNVTYALNIVFSGLLTPDDRVVTTGIEHNSVMRPLRALEAEGMDLVIVPCDAQGFVDMVAMAKAITPVTALVVCTHASNVIGVIQPVPEIAQLARRAGALCMVDAAQTAGVLPIDVQVMGIDLLAFTGHKGLQGPPGTGGLIIAEDVDESRIRPVFAGGTGSRSEREEQPEMLPDRFEVGTGNGVGLAGLGAGIRHIRARGVEAIREHEIALTEQLVAGLAAIPGVSVYGPESARKRTATVSIRVAGKSESEVGMLLDDRYDIMSRVGLHCSPACHRTIGTFPAGTIRLAAGLDTTESDIARTVQAIREIA